MRRWTLLATMPPAFLARVQCIVIDGADARRFAQAQFSGDVHALKSGHWRWNAWLDAQGRVQALMHLADVGDGRLLAVLRGGDAEEVRSRLVRYVLRMQAALTTCTFGGYIDGGLPMGLARRDRQDIVLGYGERSLRLRRESADSSPEPTVADSWRLADIRAGWPTVHQGNRRFLPPALGLERLGAVSFEKGCYPGQEIAARLHFRGGHKLRLLHIRGSAPLQIGTHQGSKDTGVVDVLESAFSTSEVEALIVAERDLSCEIKLLENKYRVVSTFDS